MDAQPPRRRQAAQADAEQHHGQHQGEGQVAGKDEELQEAKPDHLKRQDYGAAKECSRQQAAA